jgi:hypothetical protein
MADSEQAPIYTFLDENFAGDTFTQQDGRHEPRDRATAGAANESVLSLAARRARADVEAVE